MDKVDTRWVVQTWHDENGCKVVKTHQIYMTLTEAQIALMQGIFDSSPVVQCAVCGRKKGGEHENEEELGY